MLKRRPRQRISLKLSFSWSIRAVAPQFTHRWWATKLLSSLKLKICLTSRLLRMLPQVEDTSSCVRGRKFMLHPNPWSAPLVSSLLMWHSSSGWRGTRSRGHKLRRVPTFSRRSMILTCTMRYLKSLWKRPEADRTQSSLSLGTT